MTMPVSIHHPRIHSPRKRSTRVTLVLTTAAILCAAWRANAESPAAPTAQSPPKKVEGLNALEGAGDYFALMKQLAIPDRQDLPQLFVAGDSISQHYAPALKVALADKINVTHWMDLPTRYPKAVPATPFSGTSQLLIEMLTSVLNSADYHPRFLLLNAGLHDATYEIPPEQYRANVIKVVELAKQHDAKMVWVLTTPREKGDAHNPRIDAYNVEARKIMDERHIPIIDLHKFAVDQIEKHGEAATYNGDGLHYSIKVRNLMGAYIAQQLLDILKDDLPPAKDVGESNK
jgi:lysophospholipase L1-like esterase